MLVRHRPFLRRQKLTESATEWNDGRPRRRQGRGAGGPSGTTLTRELCGTSSGAPMRLGSPRFEDGGRRGLLATNDGWVSSMVLSRQSQASAAFVRLSVDRAVSSATDRRAKEALCFRLVCRRRAGRAHSRWQVGGRSRRVTVRACAIRVRGRCPWSAAEGGERVNRSAGIAHFEMQVVAAAAAGAADGADDLALLDCRSRRDGDAG